MQTTGTLNQVRPPLESECARILQGFGKIEHKVELLKPGYGKPVRDSLAILEKIQGKTVLLPGFVIATIGDSQPTCILSDEAQARRSKALLPVGFGVFVTGSGYRLNPKPRESDLNADIMPVSGSLRASKIARATLWVDQAIKPLSHTITILEDPDQTDEFFDALHDRAQTLFDKRCRPDANAGDRARYCIAVTKSARLALAHLSTGIIE